MKSLRSCTALFCLVSLFFMTGCAGVYTGGGFMDSASDPEAKATMGFNVHVEDPDPDIPLCEKEADGTKVKGQLQYCDHGDAVKFHAKINYAEIALDECEPGLGFNYLHMRGAYKPQPANLGPGGTVYFYAYELLDGSEIVEVQCVGGVFNGYYNSGPKRGGEIQYHPPN